MRISICTTVILVFSIYGCSQTAEGELYKPVAGEEHDQGEEETVLMPDAAEQDMLTYIIDGNSAVITGLQAEYGNSLQENMSIHREIEIPDTLGGYSVVEIGDHAFENTKLKKMPLTTAEMKCFFM